MERQNIDNYVDSLTEGHELAKQLELLGNMLQPAKGYVLTEELHRAIGRKILALSLTI